MSKLGKAPIAVPKGTEIKTNAKEITVKGPKGTLTFPLIKGITIKLEEGFATVEQDE